jgi:hypothetical protein
MLLTPVCRIRRACSSIFYAPPIVCSAGAFVGFIRFFLEPSDDNDDSFIRSFVLGPCNSNKPARRPSLGRFPKRMNLDRHPTEVRWFGKTLGLDVRGSKAMPGDEPVIRSSASFRIESN